MAYVPNATTVTEPIESRPVESAALEFRILKEYVVELAEQVATEDAKDLRVPESTVSPIPAVGGRAGKVLGFDASGQPIAVAISGANDPSLRAELAASSGASLVGFRQDGTGAVSTTVQSKLLESVSVKDFGALSSAATDQSSIFQAAANQAKALGISLLVNSQGPATQYAINNVDISGLDVWCEPGVTFVSPTGATGAVFKAVGTANARVTTPTRLFFAKHNAGGSQKNLFSAEYCDDVLVYMCQGSGYAMPTLTGGSSISLSECKRPVVSGGNFKDGVNGILFVSCESPTAENVTTNNQGRDGILFYSSQSGSTTTDATAINCTTVGYCVNGEAGRGGVHFYGVRRAKAIGCNSRNDNSQTNDDTGAIRFRDCEDFVAEGYSVKDCRTGVLVNEIGDYAGAPHYIIARGAIGAGNISSVVKYGIFVANDVPCPVSGARVSSVTDTSALAAGIRHGGIGDISAVLQSMDCIGVNSRGSGSKISVVCSRVGTGSTAIPAVAISGHAVVSDCVFSDDRGTPTSTMAIRAYSGANVTLGANHFGAGITDFVQVDSGSTVKRASVPIRTKFSGTPSFSGTVEAGVQAVDPNGIIYMRQSSAWYALPQYAGKNTTANRPTLAASQAGALYLDTTLDADGKPIWWTGTAWVDSTGATV